MVKLRLRVGPKGQVVIPKPIRDELAIKPGDTVQWDVDNDRAVLRKATPDDAYARLVNLLPKRDMSKVDWHGLYESQYE